MCRQSGLPPRARANTDLIKINIVRVFQALMAQQIKTEASMRIPALAILTIFTVLASDPALAQTYSPGYPVCMHAYRWGGSDVDCSYTSLGQCAASASGRGGTCVVNPFSANAQIPVEPNYRRHRRAY